jgi:hypothetical protein
VTLEVAECRATAPLYTRLSYPRTRVSSTPRLFGSILGVSETTYLKPVIPGMNAIAFSRRCALLRASKDDGPTAADTSFEARYARTSG